MQKNQAGPAPKPYEAFGYRLTIAVLRKHRNLMRFVAILKQNNSTSRGAFYMYAAGKRFPQEPATLKLYEQLLETPPQWLANGAGEPVAVLRRAASAIEEDDDTDADLLRVLRFLDGGGNVPVISINHASQENASDSGKLAKIRHIPVLSDKDLSDLLSGARTIGDMLSQTIPFTADFQGDGVFAYVLSRTDFSMTAPGEVFFRPGTTLIFAQHQIIEPGSYVLARRRLEEKFMFRRYRAAFDYGTAKEFTLEAINPSFDPIHVTDTAEWQIVGRLMISQQRW